MELPFDPAAVEALIRRTASEVVMPRFRGLSAGDVREKRPGDLVTVADVEAERVLSDGLLKFEPAAFVLGEEAAAEDPGLLDHLDRHRSIWVIDPIDGTSNYAKGRETFTIMVAYVVGDRPLCAWIHDPVGDRMLTARLGHGASINGAAIARSSTTQNAEHGSGMISYRYCPKGFRDLVRERGDALPTHRPLWCAGHEYIRLAEGRSDFACFWRALPWDHAAGALIAHEIGGEARHLDGKTYSVANVRGGILTTCSKRNWNLLHQHLFSGIKNPCTELK